MTHTLRKYLSSRGSALFMVLSTMTALLIVVMAMYFSVVSSRSVQYAVFNTEQSYQSSISVSDAVIAGLNQNKFPELSEKLAGMDVGTKISTDGNGFSSLINTGTKADDNQLGAYDVEITRLDNEEVDDTTYQVYDFCVTSSVNGVTETTHTLVRVEQGGVKPTLSDRFFTATGYLPNDNWIMGGEYKTDVHIDSAYVKIGIGAGPNIYSGLTCAGSAEISSLGHSAVLGNTINNNPRVWAFGNDLTLSGTVSNSGKIDMFGNNDEHGYVIVGGDLIAEGMWYFPKNTDFYVLGNVYAQGIQFGGNLFVVGDIYLSGTHSDNTSQHIYTNNGSKIYLGDGSKIYDEISNTFASHVVEDCNKITPETWLASGSYNSADYDGGAKIYTREEILSKLNSLIGSNNYPKWVVDYSSLKGVNSDDPLEIVFNSDGDSINSSTGAEYKDSKGNVVEPRMTFESEELVYKEGENEGCVIGNIYDVTEWGAGGNTGTPYTIIIDTGDDVGNIFTIRVNANRDMDGDGVAETFSWKPYPNTIDSTSEVNILVKGRGSVIIDIPAKPETPADDIYNPEGVIYQASSFEFFGHMNWYALLGGRKVANATYGDVYTNTGIISRQNMADYVRPFIHTDCNTSYECVYSDTDDEGNLVEGYWCTTHQCVVSTQDTYVDKNGNTICACVNRVGRKEIDKYILSNSININDGTWNLDTNNNLIYPTVNIWLISCDENAQIRLALTKDGNKLIYDTLFGYVYAPYMTFTADGQSGSQGLRMVGGLIVSDMVINDYYEYLYCRPETDYADLIGDDAEFLTSSGNISWRKYGY